MVMDNSTTRFAVVALTLYLSLQVAISERNTEAKTFVEKRMVVVIINLFVV